MPAAHGAYSGGFEVRRWGAEMVRELNPRTKFAKLVSMNSDGA